MADALAKEARELPSNEFGGATVSWKKERAKAMITKNWRMAWRERRGGSASAGLSVLGREPSRSYPDCMETIANAPRHQAARTIQVLLGHGWFGEFYERFNLNGDVECACGAQRETRDHILLRCPLFAEHRHILWRGDTLIGMYNDFIFSTKEGKLLLLKFLEKTDAFFKQRRPPEDPDPNDDDHPAEGPVTNRRPRLAATTIIQRRSSNEPARSPVRHRDRPDSSPVDPEENIRKQGKVSRHPRTVQPAPCIDPAHLPNPDS
jgi:hypothetical protein